MKYFLIAVAIIAVVIGSGSYFGNTLAQHINTEIAKVIK